MNRKAFNLLLAGLLTAGSSVAMACEYKAGETEFAEYATCRYGSEAVVVVDLPEGSSWEQCVYQLAAFRPEKLLAVTKMNNGKEEHSINSRGNIGNPCYLTKQQCDKALDALQASQN
jgi:hypothetical protein